MPRSGGIAAAGPLAGWSYLPTIGELIDAAFASKTKVSTSSEGKAHATRVHPCFPGLVQPDETPCNPSLFVHCSSGIALQDAFGDNHGLRCNRLGRDNT